MQVKITIIHSIALQYYYFLNFLIHAKITFDFSLQPRLLHPLLFAQDKCDLSYGKLAAPNY